MSVSFSAQSAPARLDPKAVLTLLKPVTWFPPMWAFTCGAISAGVPLSDRKALLALGIGITGPLVCASSQAVNDWFDRHVDAINEPSRPIPSGRIPGQWGLTIAIVWTVLCLVAALPLGAFGMSAVAIALLFSWGYSAPPFRFKRNGWVGNAAVGFTYEGLAWVTGAGIMLGTVERQTTFEVLDIEPEQIQLTMLVLVLVLDVLNGGLYLLQSIIALGLVQSLRRTLLGCRRNTMRNKHTFLVFGSHPCHEVVNLLLRGRSLGSNIGICSLHHNLVSCSRHCILHILAFFGFVLIILGKVNSFSMFEDILPKKKRC
jgi:hypothetical protein